ncbi:uncharacterized protein LOC108671312 isoform X3 [Hyalella azteca]|uniref:Uncharacterized protein LOC108671312 isoform X3 n=1 Tax=Hyalella azteca TaxID=294128 RepID=A0A979FN71_HYAAZ|nr:uncharacterized protein LOC108671312 isoform X3 [Hyalella azteca]
MPQAQEVSIQAPLRAPHRLNNNNDGELLLLTKDKPLGGWDDAPGSPHRVPLISNNNGSPRLTNRIANIYGLGKQQPQVIASPHGSPRHRALARLTKPAQEIVRKVINLPPKTEPLEPASPKLSRKISREDAKEIEEILSIPRIGLSSPKHNFYLNQSGNPSPGYHNPYQQTQAGVIKSPFTPTRETKFRYEHLSPKPVVDNNHVNSRLPVSPRRFFSSRESLLENDTSEGLNCVNENERCDSRNDSRLKSRLPVKLLHLKELKYMRPSSPGITDCEDDISNNKESLRPSANMRSDRVTNCNTNILINDIACSVQSSASSSNVKEPADVDSNHSQLTDDPKQRSGCQYSRDWNSAEFSMTNDNSTSWNSAGSESDQKMSVEEKVSIKKSSEDSMRPRTNSFGSWSHSNASADKSSAASLGNSTAGVEMIPSDTDSGLAESLSSKMVLIKCKGGTYLSRIFLNNGGIEGVKVVGRVGGVPSPQLLPSSPHPSPAIMSAAPSPVHLSNKVSVGGSVVSDASAGSCGPDGCCYSGADRPAQHEGEFDHDTADYQWLLDYEYRESYTRESLGAGGRDGLCRASVLDTNPEPDLQDLSYETLSRHLDANLAEIDMDDFRSDDINQLLALPSVCAQCRLHDHDGEESAEPSANNTPTKSRRPTMCRHNAWRQCQHYEDYDLEEEEFSGVSGDISLYQSGPLFSPLKEPPPIGNTTFSVDSLDCESLHEDLILTCQANKDNYTIAFEGSFIQYSEDSDYHEAGESDTTGSGSWTADRLEDGQSPAPAMTHSDQPYTTWSRVGRKSSPSCRTPDPSGAHKTRAATSHLSPAGRTQEVLHKQILPQQLQPAITATAAGTAKAAHESHEENNSKSNSMPNLMRRSLLRQSIDTGVQCIKVFDLQNSLRSSHSSARQAEGNSFSLVRLFMKQKSLSKEAISLSSSCTSRSHEGACCSSSDNPSAVDSSDWPMNSQSDDMEGSASPVPHSVMRNNQAIIERGMRRRSGGDINPRNINSNSGDFGSTSSDIISPTAATILLETDGSLVNNNNAVNQILDNTGPVGAFDNTANFEESLKEVCPCSKPPMTSPIREEPEGMDISFDSRSENKLVNDQSESETKISTCANSGEKKISESGSSQSSPTKERSKDSNTGSPNKNVLGAHTEGRNRSQSPSTPKKSAHRRDGTQRQRQNSGNSSSGYASTKGSIERLRSASDSHTPQHTPQRPRPKPRALKQMADQCLQTSNLKVSATMNTSNLMDRKDVYVYYPNYALPDLSFLKDKKYSVDSRIFLVPQHYRRPPVISRKVREGSSRRPFSCNDMEKLRKRGLSHIKDWESLNVLLPKELKEMLSDNTECMETVKPSYCISPKSPRRPNSCDFGSAKTSNSNTSLSTQPSSGYRGSSTILNDSETNQQLASGEEAPSVPKRSVSLPSEEGVEDMDNPPPRPPLPRGILRKVTSLRDESQKQGAKKRHSAADSPDRLSRDDVARRRSLPESMDAGQEERDDDQPCRTEADGGAAEMNCSCITACTGFCGKGLRLKNLLPVSELPNVSSHEEFTEEDLAALRSRVSNFLVGKNLTEENTCAWCPKKSVSFAGHGCQHSRQTVESAYDVPSKIEERPVVYDAQDKRALVMSVRVAVEKLVSHFSHSHAAKPKPNGSGGSSVAAQLTLEKLCPAIYALLSDGLQPSLHSLFGKIANSVWKMIEATSQMGPTTKALSDLVLTLNSEECLSEGPMKFNAFIFGLLNIRSLDAWLSYLRTRESILQKHFHPEAFLYLSSTATRNLYDDLLMAVRPLSLLPLHLDLLYEYKLLHASLLKMEERLMIHTSSTGNSPGDRPSSVLLDHLLVAKETKEFKNTAAAQQDRVKALMKVLTSPESTEADLLQTVAASVTKERSRSPRPRSCYDNADAVGDDLHPALKKRWSNVQLGSKLITAIDKLMLEETNAASGSSEDFSDSIDNPKTTRALSQNSVDEVSPAMRDSDISTKDDDISERSATDKDTENEKGQRLCPTSLIFGKGKESEGDKFRRLQLKWELMTGCELPSKCQDAEPSDATDETTPLADGSGHSSTSPSQTVREKVVSPSSGSRSKIPRPVSMTSPQRPFKVFEPAKEKTSPQIKPPLHARPFGSSPLTSKDLPKPAPRRSLKDKSDDSRPMTMRTRVSPKVGGGANVVATGNRASSMPGRSDSMERGSSHSTGGGGRYVQTLHHRLATDNGHLSFNRGDCLQVVVEVDDRYLLCCLNGRKGLVPRASVIACADQ